MQKYVSQDDLFIKNCVLCIHQAENETEKKPCLLWLNGRYMFSLFIFWMKWLFILFLPFIFTVFSRWHTEIYPKCIRNAPSWQKIEKIKVDLTDSSYQ